MTIFLLTVLNQEEEEEEMVVNNWQRFSVSVTWSTCHQESCKDSVTSDHNIATNKNKKRSISSSSKCPLMKILKLYLIVT